MKNLTPHAIVLSRTDGSTVTFEPSGDVARVSTTETVVGYIHGVHVVTRALGAATGLPDDGTPCIVSAMVLAACPGRAGVYAPDSGSTAIRNDRGQIVAVTRLVSA